MPRKTNWVPIALTYAAIGTGLYLLLRPRTALPAPSPAPGPLPPPPGGTTPLPRPEPSTASPAALVARLRASAAARKVFMIQSLFYSLGYSSIVPDGVEESALHGLLTTLYAQSGVERPSDPIDVKYADLALRTLLRRSPERFLSSARLLPYVLPQDLIDLINREAGALDPDWPMLQVRPELAPAGATREAGSARSRSHLRPAFVSMRD